MKADKKIENIKSIIITKLEESRKKMLKQVQGRFTSELRELRELETQTNNIKKKLEKKLPLGYGISGNEIYVSSHYSDDVIPEDDLAVLRKISELYIIGKAEDAQKQLSNLLKKYKIGG